MPQRDQSNKNTKDEQSNSKSKGQNRDGCLYKKDGDSPTLVFREQGDHMSDQVGGDVTDTETREVTTEKHGQVSQVLRDGMGHVFMKIFQNYRRYTSLLVVVLGLKILRNGG